MTGRMIEVGMEAERRFKVTEDMAASFIGSGDVSVLSTPSMIALMETTARDLVQSHLPPEETTVGTAVNVRHLAPAPVGGEVTVKAKLVEVDRRRLVFEVKCLYGDTLVGEGTHERFIVNRQKFLSKLSGSK